MEARPTCTDCDEAGDYVVPNVLRPMGPSLQTSHNGRNCTTHRPIDPLNCSEMIANYKTF